MGSIMVVSDGRNRVCTCVLHWAELWDLDANKQRLFSGNTLQCGDDLLKVSSNTVAEIRQQFLVEREQGYMLTMPRDLLDRLLNGSPSPKDPADRVVRDTATIDAIGWAPKDLCKCGEPLWSDSKRCCECGEKIEPVRETEPQSYADQITFQVIGRTRPSRVWENVADEGGYYDR